MPAFSLSASQYSHIYQQPEYKDFATYLRQSISDPFVLNLRNASLMEVISACSKAKSRLHPHYPEQIGSLVHNLKILEKENGVILKPVQVTDIFWGFFVSFLQERGLKPPTIETLASQLRSILNWAVKYNATVSPTYTDVVIPRVTIQEIALTADEVSRIAYFDVDLFYANRRADFRERMKRIRDLFVLSCNLGQRHSDMVRVEPSCFDQNIFRITQQKTGNLAVVNIDQFAIDAKTTYRILEKYGYYAPYTSSIANYNRGLHVLLRDAGLNDLVRIEERINGKVVATNVPKWKLVSSHTARRSFVTVNVLRGKNIHAVRRCTAHTDTRCFERYIRDDD